MKRSTVPFILVALLALLAACAPSTAPTPEQTAATVPPPAVQVETQPTLPAQPTLPPATEPPQATMLPEATALPAATELAPAAALPEATALPQPTALPEPTADPGPAIVYGVTDEGAYFYGNPDAPVTLIDYSDFL